VAKGKGKDFFKSAGLKLNREIKEERKQLAKQRPREGAFIKQVRADQAGKGASKEVRESGTFRPFEGKAVVAPKETVTANFEVDPAKVEENEPNKGFSHQVNWNADRNGVK
jgi:hypothetical protein